MVVGELVHVFYDKFWNEIDLAIADEILHKDVTFRGSLGVGVVGRKAVCEYVLKVTEALSGYRCDIESLLVEGNRAVAKVVFSGLHAGEFLGYAPTGRRVQWLGAAFFTEDDNQLRDIWVLGDLENLKAQLSLTE